MLRVHIFLLFLLSTGSSVDLDDPLLVRTTHGLARGVRQTAANGKDVDVWWGIPYAEPPVGDLRFRSPKSVKSWDGEYQATSKPNSCVQIKDEMFPDFAGADMWNANTELSEDCLYLNVAVPNPRPNNSAILLWIYGGSFYSGTSTLDVYDPKVLASEQNVIVASIQYRVASLGFLYVGGVGGVDGNAGLLDQRMAIKWIRDNARAFGGNPDNITLFSESAGSASVAFHLLSPGSAHLFSQAIMQSAGATNPWAMITAKEATLRARRLAEVLKCPHQEDQLSYLVDCLREANATDMVNAEWNGITSGIMGCPFVPVLDGDFFPESPGTALRKQNFKKTKIMLGANQNEGFFFLLYFLTETFQLKNNISVTRAEFSRYVKELNPYVSPLGLEAISYEYTDWMDPNNSNKMIVALDKMVGDYQFTCPTLELAQRYADTMQPQVVVYQYYFNHRASVHPWPKWTGVLHGDEINFIFGEPLNTTHFSYTEEEKQLSRDMMTTWANFAKTGNPNLYENGSWIRSFYWPVYSRTSKEYLSLNPRNKSKGLGFSSRKCAFWNKYLPSLLASTDPTEECTSQACHEQCNPDDYIGNDPVIELSDTDPEKNLNPIKSNRDKSMHRGSNSATSNSISAGAVALVVVLLILLALILAGS